MSQLAFGTSTAFNTSRIFVGKQGEDVTEHNWIAAGGYSDFSTYDLYVSSLYFTVTTIVTVGYGDITA